MAKLCHTQSKVINPTYIFSIISLATGIFGWILGIFIMLVSFTPLSTHFPFGRIAGLFLLISPGVSWLIAIITGIIGGGQIKRKGHQQGNRLAKSGIVLSGIGCVLFYGFLLLIALGFYILISKGYVGFILRSGNVPF
jgi:uncharacterized membrane protein